MNRFKDVLKLFGIYILVGLAVNCVIGLAWGIYSKCTNPEVSILDIAQNMPSLMTMLVCNVANVFIVLMAWKLKMIRLPECLKMSKQQWSKAALPLALAVSWFICDVFIQDLSSIEENESVVKIFSDCAHSVLGLLCICIVGPICEELIMREGFLGIMLKNKVNPWVAIVISACIFGAMHLNWSQFAAASIGGLVLGILYWKTGNIVLSSIIHIINNSFGVVLFLATECSAEEVKLYNYLGGRNVGIALCCLFAVISVLLLVRYVKREEKIA